MEQWSQTQFACGRWRQFLGATGPHMAAVKGYPFGGVRADNFSDTLIAAATNLWKERAVRFISKRQDLPTEFSSEEHSSCGPNNYYTFFSGEGRKVLLCGRQV